MTTSTAWPPAYKTLMMQGLEHRNNGKDIRDIIVEATRASRNLSAAAESLGVSRQVLGQWVARLGLFDLVHDAA
jgi:transcriptional regulator with PAS, ATPase and Fis domain